MTRTSDDPFIGPRQRLAEQRKTQDAAEATRQADSDADRQFERSIHDQTRKSVRGDRQLHEGVVRERDAEDRVLVAERTRSRRLRRLDRAGADERAATAQVSADAALDAVKARASDTAQELRGAVWRARAELGVATGLVETLLEALPVVPGVRGDSPREAATQVAASIERVRRALALAYDADAGPSGVDVTEGDGQRDVGGSG